MILGLIIVLSIQFWATININTNQGIGLKIIEGPIIVGIEIIYRAISIIVLSPSFIDSLLL